MKIRPIRTEEDHKAALAEVARLMDIDPAPGTPAGDILDVLATLVENYEDKHSPIESPDPIAAIQYRMEISGYKTKDLGEVLGSSPRASEVLNRRRRLTVEMIRRLVNAWGIPAHCLIQPYELVPKRA